MDGQNTQGNKPKASSILNTLLPDENGPPSEELGMSPEFNKLSNNLYNQLDMVKYSNQDIEDFTIDQQSEIDTELDKKKRFGAVDIYPQQQENDGQEIKVTNKGKKLTHKIYTDDVSAASEILLDDSEYNDDILVQKHYQEIEQMQKTKQQQPDQMLTRFLQNFQASELNKRQEPQNLKQANLKLDQIQKGLSDCCKDIQSKVGEQLHIPFNVEDAQLLLHSEPMLLIEFVAQFVSKILSIGILEQKQENQSIEQKIRSLSQIMNIESSGNEGENDRPYPFRDDDTGCIDDLSIGSIKNRERYEIQSVLKRPEDSQGNRIECADYNDLSQSKSANQSPSQIKALKARADTSKNAENNKLEKNGTNLKQQSEKQNLTTRYGYQSNSQLTSQRSNYTSMEGPPKVYEEIMRNLEADIRKHIRIEHQLKLHIESVEDRVEELEREQEGFENKTKELESFKLESQNLKKQLTSKQEILEVKEILLQKQVSDIQDIKTNNVGLKSDIEQLEQNLQELKNEKDQLVKELKVIKSQSQRDKEKLQRLNNQRNAAKTQGPYESFLEEQHGIDMIKNVSNNWPNSGISGESEQSQASRSLTGQNHTNSLQQQPLQAHDRLSFSENRAQNSTQIHNGAHTSTNQQDTVGQTRGALLPQNNNNGFNSNKSKNAQKPQVSQNNNFIQVQGGNNHLIGDLLLMGAATSSSHSAGRNNTSSAINSDIKTRSITGRQNGRDSSRSKNQGSKQTTGQSNSQQVQYQYNNQNFNQSMNALSGNQYNNYAVPQQSSGNSKGKRGKKQSAHGSLEKRTNQLLYGTQNPAINSHYYVGGPQLQIKMQNISIEGAPNQPYNIINANSLSPGKTVKQNISVDGGGTEKNNKLRQSSNLQQQSFNLTQETQNQSRTQSGFVQQHQSQTPKPQQQKSPYMKSSKTNNKQQQIQAMAQAQATVLASTLQSVHTSSQKLNSNSQLQNIYSNNQKQQFRGNKNQAVQKEQLIQRQQYEMMNSLDRLQQHPANSRNQNGIITNYNTVGANIQNRNAQNMEPIRKTSSIIQESKVSFKGQNIIQTIDQKAQITNGQSRVPSDISGTKVGGLVSGCDTSSTGGTAVSALKRRASSQMANRQSNQNVSTKNQESTRNLQINEMQASLSKTKRSNQDSGNNATINQSLNNTMQMQKQGSKTSVKRKNLAVGYSAQNLQTVEQLQKSKNIGVTSKGKANSRTRNGQGPHESSIKLASASVNHTYSVQNTNYQNVPGSAYLTQSQGSKKLQAVSKIDGNALAKATSQHQFIGVNALKTKSQNQYYQQTFMNGPISQKKQIPSKMQQKDQLSGVNIRMGNHSDLLKK